MNAAFADLLLLQTPDAAIITTRDGTVLYWSEQAADLLGYTSAEATGQSIDALIVPPAQQDREREVLRDTTGLATFEVTRVRKDGSRLDAVASYKCVRNGVDEQILITLKDVTQLKVQRDAKRIEVQFRNLLEFTPDAILMTNASGRIVLANGQAEELFGYSRGALVGNPIEHLLPSRYRAGHVRHRSAYTEHPRTRAMGAGIDLYGLRRDGTEFPVEISLSPLQTDEGTLVMSAIRDVTERRAIARTLQEKNAELERAGQAKDRFLASMSHELRTPLNGIIGFAEFLSDGKPGPLNDKQKEYLDDILQSGRHLLHLINDMLDLVKIRAGKIDLRCETFPILEAVEEVCAGMHPIAARKGIEVTVDVAPNLPQVSLDRQRVKQILYNLISNAVKFTGEEGHVHISAALVPGDRFQLVVADDGIGIGEEDMGRLFLEFEQLENGISRRFGGTGLGLALTRTLVHHHGGAITVESELGKGSRFIVELPLTADGGTT